MILLDCNKKMLEFVLEQANLNCYIEFYGKKMTYSKFFRLVDNLSYNLLEFGLKKGDTVTLMLPNCPQFAMLIYALSNIGVVASMISPLISAAQTKAIMQRTNSKLLFVSTVAKESVPDVQKIVVDFTKFAGLGAKLVMKKSLKAQGDKFEKFLKSPKTKPTLPQIDPHDTAFYLNSGGTTGEPKTVMLSQFAINTSAFNIVNNLDENELTMPTLANSIYILPMFYGYGLSVLHTQFTSSCNQYIRTKFRPNELAKDIAKHNVELMFGVPIMYKKMLKTNIFNSEVCNKLKVCYSGGEKLSETLQNDFNKAFPSSIIVEGYGLSEAVAAFVSQSKRYHKKGSCGRLFHKIQIEAFDGNQKLPRGTDGEICVCTNSIMNGYYNDKENTDKVIFVLDGKRWLRTGDFGRVDEDGYVFLSSRIKNIIKRKGINIFPSQIEACLMKLDFIKDVVVFGYKDVQEVERIICAVIFNGAAPDDYENKIKDFVKTQLSVLSSPEYILVKDRFDLTQVGKVNTLSLTNELKQKYNL